MQSSEWQGYALKAAAGLVAVAVLGYAAYQLAKEDELETVQPLVKKKVGKLQVEYKGANGNEVVELHQLLKIMSLVTDLTNKKMEKAYATKQMTHETFLQKRYELYAAQNWCEYEDLLKWELAEQERAYGSSLSVVARAMKVDKQWIIFSAVEHGQNMASLSAMTDCLADQEKTRKPKLNQSDTINYLCYLEEERTRQMLEAMETGATDDIKNSTDKETAKQNFYFMINAKIYDKLRELHGVSESELSFCARYYKTDQEPQIQAKMQEGFIKIMHKRASLSEKSQ